MRNHIATIIYSAILCLAWRGYGQQTQPAHHKVLTPEQTEYQKQYQQWFMQDQQLQARGKQVFDAEMAREKAGDCPDARSTYDFNLCYGKQLDITEQNLKSFEATIHDLLAPAPQMQREPVTPSAPASPILTAAQLTTKFDSVEQSWRRYREVACTAAYHQFDGGTGAPSFELQCRLQLTRDHMRELNMIYDGALRR